MGQREVLNFLEKHKGEWFTARQIGERLKLSTVSTSLRKLKYRSDVEYKEGKAYLYRK